MTHRHRNLANAGRRGTRWENTKRQTFEVWGTNCWWCGHPGAHEVDHLVRIRDGGDPYDLDNCRPSHGSNSPCPVCISPRTRRARCCNQERNGRGGIPPHSIYVYIVDASTI